MAEDHDDGSRLDIAMDWALAHSIPITRTRGLAVGLLLVALIALLDFAIGPDVEFTILYALPVTIVAWSGKRQDGLVMAGFTAISWSTVQSIAHPAPAPAWAIALLLLTRFAALALIALAFTSVRRATERLSELADHDPLTHLLNRRALFERVEVELARGERHPAALTLLYFDIDDFKAINDREGHEAGDRLLQDLASEMTTTLRPEDLSARVGGDEFVGVLPQTDSEGARASATRLQERLNAVAQRYGSSVSTGVVTFLSSPPTVDAALAAADDNMYRSKRSGFGRVAFEVRQ